MTTIKDIAKLANVTLGTVSRALNNEPGVGEKTREKILQIAKELNYKRSTPAKRQAEAPTPKTIGIIWFRGKGLFFTHMCAQLEQEAHARGCSILVSFANPDRAFQMMNRHAVDHVLFWTGPSWMPTLNFLQTKEQFRGNMLIIGGGPLEQAHRISIDRKGAGYQAVAHLAALGHTRIGFVGLESDKLIGFTMGMLELKLDYQRDSIILISRETPFHEDRFLQLMKRPPRERPTAFVVDSQGNLFVFVHALRKHGFRVPEDFSIVTYDSIAEMNILLDVPLTTVGPNINHLAKLSVELLLSNPTNSGDDGGWQHFTVESELVVGASTAPPS